MSPIFLDVLLTVALMFVIGIPLIMKTIWLPGALQFEEVSDGALDERQQRFFGGTDEKIRDLGFRPLKTFRVKNMIGKNLLRVYTSSSDAARIWVGGLRVKGGVVNYTEIITKFQDGTRLNTSNSGTAPIFDPLPGDVKQRCPGVRDLAELKRRHDAKALQLASRGAAYFDDARFFEDYQDYHRRYVEHQGSRKLLRLDPGTGIYHATPKLGLRGIRNYLNPLAGNFTLPRFLLAVVFGTGLPLALLFVPFTAYFWIAARLRVSIISASVALTVVAFTLAGVAVGCLFGRKWFIWAFLLSLPPAYLMAQRGANPLLWCVWMAIVAHWAGRLLAARQRIV
jgi:hypothetical protein